MPVINTMTATIATDARVIKCEHEYQMAFKEHWHEYHDITMITWHLYGHWNATDIVNCCT